MIREDLSREFQKAMGQTHDLSIYDDDTAHVARVLYLNMQMVLEEASELADAYNGIMTELNNGYSPFSGQVEHFLKELADLQYVISGMASALGLDLEEAVKRVHASNMTKLDEDGNPVRNESGKVIKGPNYEPPDLSDLVDPLEVISG